MVSVLVETASGYALLKLEKDSLVRSSPAEVSEKLSTVKGAKKCLKLQTFKRFEDVKQATAEISALTEGKIGDVLKSLLKKNVVKAGLANDGLAVWDKQLAQNIKKKYDIDVLVSPAIHEIFRGVKSHMEDLVADLSKEEGKTMAMALAHSLNRFKLKFSPEKVDVMVIQAVGLLDDLDKELNNLAMRLKEWYGFHFPELLKLVTDNSTFARLVKLMRYRHQVEALESFEDLVPAEVEAQIRQAAETSMGSDLVDADLENILEVADRVLELAEYRRSLCDYLRMRMMTIAPNLTHIVGEILAARLLAQAGSLMGLAKQASSTVQILGAEKALFRALKSKSNTPKYGLIYHAQLVGQAAPKLKGKLSRILAAKLSLCSRVDALKDSREPTVAIGAKAYVERRLEELTEGTMTTSFKQASGTATVQTPKYIPARLAGMQTPQYNTSADQIGRPVVSVKPETVKSEPIEEQTTADRTHKKDKKRKHESSDGEHEEKKKKKRKHESSDNEHEKKKKKHKKSKKD